MEKPEIPTIKDQLPLRDLQIFHEIARALTSSLDLDSILHVILQQMEQFFQPRTWTLLLVDENRKDLYYAIAAGELGPSLKDLRVPMGEGMAGWVAAHGETLIVPEVTSETRLDPHLATAASGHHPFRVHSAVCIPLRSRLRTLGVIQFFNCPPEAFTDHAISLLLVLCDYAAIAIENARVFERVQELTITDECTGLYNLRHFYRTLNSEIERSGRFGSEFSLIFIDLDYFKLVNDRYGHQAGSRLLAEVSATIKSQVRTVDLTFRYGGDEFIVLLPETSKTPAIEVASRLLHTLRRTNHQLSEDVRLNIRASFGVSSYPEDGITAHEVLQAADAVMYRVKGSTRDGVAAASPVQAARSA